jgi:tRNA 2-selenouridine synthase
MVRAINSEHFLKLKEYFPVIDVRTPAEYLQGHLPGSCNVPLFSDEERREVGIAYKQNGRKKAILNGLDMVGPKMRQLAETAIAQIEAGHWRLQNKFQKKKGISEATGLVLCWRGGMRSGSVAWLLSLFGYRIFTLKKGYKAYRNHVLNSFKKERELIILGGFTGSGKTQVLRQLAQMGERVVDLEKIACHKGSAFGSLGEEPQPSQEHFENLLSNEWQKSPHHQYLWHEDESQMLGKRRIPNDMWQQLRNAKVLFLEIPQRERLEFIIGEYGEFSQEKLIDGIKRIERRMGGKETQETIENLSHGNLREASKRLLDYYDKSYSFSLKKRIAANIIHLQSNTYDAKTNAEIILNWKQKYLAKS